MNSNVIYPLPGDPGETSAKSTYTVAAVLACIRNGMNVASKARHLYAMSDEALRREGLTRKDIPAHLARLL